MYDVSYFENAKRAQISDIDLAEIGQRELEKKELLVDFYRISVRLPYPLPINGLSKAVPDVLSFPYPFSIWVTWDLMERFEILYRCGAHERLRCELAAMASFDSFTNESNAVSLCTAHMAQMLSQGILRLGIEDGIISDGAKRLLAVMEAEYDSKWLGLNEINETTTVNGSTIFHNIGCIVLFALSTLASTLKHSRAQEFQDKASQVLEGWHNYRLSAHPFSEGVAYDCYFLDSVLKWAEILDDYQLLHPYKDSLYSVYENAVHLALPGREEILAPIGDVEPQMTQFIDVMCRLSDIFGWDNTIIGKMNALRMPAYTLFNYTPRHGDHPDTKGFKAFPYVVSARNEERLVCFSAGGTKIGHLHYDGGSFVLGVHGNFFITDPGYQQYRGGEEQDYAMGTYAHNAPILDGKAQTKRESVLISAEENHAAVDLTGCYDNDVKVVRSFALGKNSLTVTDTFEGEYNELEYSFHIGTNLRVYEDGDALLLKNHSGSVRLSSSNFNLGYPNLKRHTASRGPMRIHVKMPHKSRISFTLEWS